jgi:hypothetical protein
MCCSLPVSRTRPTGCDCRLKLLVVFLKQTADSISNRNCQQSSGLVRLTIQEVVQKNESVAKRGKERRAC